MSWITGAQAVSEFGPSIFGPARDFYADRVLSARLQRLGAPSRVIIPDNRFSIEAIRSTNPNVIYENPYFSPLNSRPGSTTSLQSLERQIVPRVGGTGSRLGISGVRAAVTAAGRSAAAVGSRVLPALASLASNPIVLGVLALGAVAAVAYAIYKAFNPTVTAVVAPEKSEPSDADKVDDIPSGGEPTGGGLIETPEFDELDNSGARTMKEVREYGKRLQGEGFHYIHPLVYRAFHSF